MAEWFRALCIRSLINRAFNNNDLSTALGSTADIVTSLIFSPLPLDFDEKRPGFDPLSLLFNENYKAVHDLSLMEMYDGKETIEKHMQWLTPFFKEREQMFSTASFAESPEQIFKSYHSALIDNDIYSGSANHAQVGVDLGASDDDLKESFSIWLKSKRLEMNHKKGSQNIKTSFSSDDLEEWVTKGVLPYIDLFLVTKKLGVNIPFHRLGKLIFPEEYDIDTGERVRKVTKPLADHLLRTDTLNALQASVLRQLRHSE